MEEGYQVLGSEQSPGRPTLLVDPSAMRQLTLDVPTGLPQHQWRRVKRQRLIHALGQDRHYRSYVLRQEQLSDDKQRYHLVALDLKELMMAWRSCYQRMGRWPRVVLSGLGSEAVNERVSRECLLRYCAQKALRLAWYGLLCLPLLVLMLWHQHLTKEFHRLQMQWQHAVQSPLTTAEPAQPVVSQWRDKLYPQLQIVGRVFGNHVRLQSLDWKSSVLTLQAEADSVLHFSQSWDKWQRADPQFLHELVSYGYQKRPYFRAKISLTKG